MLKTIQFEFPPLQENRIAYIDISLIVCGI